MTEAALRALMLATLLLSAALLLVALLRAPLRRFAGAQGQYQLWLLAPAVLLAAGLSALQPQRELGWQIELLDADGSVPLSASSNALAATPAATPAPLWAPRLLLTGWLLGAMACALVWALAQRRLLRERRLAAGGSAALVGAWRPRLRLPADFRQRFPAPERRLILLHERLHAERGDTRWLLLALSLLALQWFNPLAWWGLSRLRADMELACDAALLRRRPGQWKTYRQALLRAEGFPSRLPLTATPCSSHPLIERLSMLPTHSLQTPRRWCAALVVALAAGFAYAANPAVAPAPPIPAVPAVEAAAPPPPSAATPAVTAVAPMAVPSRASAATRAAPPAVPVTPPAPEGNLVTASSLPNTEGTSVRVLLDVQINGKALATAIHTGESGEAKHTVIMVPGIGNYELSSRAEVLGEQRIAVGIELRELDSGKLLMSPRLISGDGVPARIERAMPGEPAIGIDLIARTPNAPLQSDRVRR